jgi:hypothetical protein
MESNYDDEEDLDDEIRKNMFEEEKDVPKKKMFLRAQTLKNMRLTRHQYIPGCYWTTWTKHQDPWLL